MNPCKHHAAIGVLRREHPRSARWQPEAFVGREGDIAGSNLAGDRDAAEQL
jgi:hypothetical protein